MRQKADKLEKGKWYWDCLGLCSILRFHHEKGGKCFYDKVVHVEGIEYEKDYGPYYMFSNYWDRFIPTPEDIEKYNLNE